VYRFVRAGLILFILLMSSVLVFAHDTEGTESEPSLWTDPVLYIKIAAGFLVFLTVVLVVAKSPKEEIKKPLFILLIVVVLLPTLYLAGHTVYENLQSESKGPIHWHADYEVLACGERLDLVNPKFPSNKIGSALFHEHNDDRIHIEGTVMHLHDIDFGSYFKVIGGNISATGFSYPVEGKGLVSYENGKQCPDGSTGTLKVYVNGKRIENPAEYLIYPHALVPPGDCIIVLFDASNSETTDVTCESWTARDWSYGTYHRNPVEVGEYSWQ